MNGSQNMLDSNATEKSNQFSEQSTGVGHFSKFPTQTGKMNQT